MTLTMAGWAVAIVVVLAIAFGAIRAGVLPYIHARRVRRALDLHRISALAGVNEDDIRLEVISYQSVLNAPRRAFHYKVLVLYWDREKAEFITCTPPRHISTLGGNYATESLIAHDIELKLNKS